MRVDKPVRGLANEDPEPHDRRYWISIAILIFLVVLLGLIVAAVTPECADSFCESPPFSST